MKTYCKNVDVTDFYFIRSSIYECLRGKWHRHEVYNILSGFGGIPANEIRCTIKYGEKEDVAWIVDRIAEHMQNNIKNKTISLPPIKFSERYDNNSKKYRIIGTQSMIHQFYEYVAVNACKELFYKKFGVYQCASIPGRGQSYGKKAIKKWLDNDVKGTRYAVKMDIKKCYPSVDQDVLRKMLARDLHKNPDLLYLVNALLDMFTEGGLSIGSHLSQWMCNYYLSYAYHFVCERLYTTRMSKRTGEVVRVRLISHALFYMDDVLIFSPNKKHLNMAVAQITEYFKNELHLTIKQNWRMFKVHYVDKNGKIHGSFVDMMGFRFYRGKVTIRQRIFISLRRKMLRFWKLLRRGDRITMRMAQSIMSYWGWIKNTNSWLLLRKYKIADVASKAKKLVSYYSRLNNRQHNVVGGI